MNKWVKKLCVLVICCVTVISAYSQQAVQYSQYLFNPLTYNPAYAGSLSDISIDGNIRTQWLGLTGAPISQSISVHLPIPKFKSGFGINIANDMIGVERTTNAQVAYNYKIRFSEFTLSAGVNAGIVQKNIDGSRLRSPDGEYDSGLTHGDVILPTSSASAIAPNFGLGVYLHNNQLWGVGLTLQHPVGISFGISELNLSYRLVPNASLHSFYTIETRSDFNFIPHLLVKSDMVKLQIDGGVIVEYQEFLQLGVGYRGYNQNSTDGLVSMLRVKVNEKLQVGYSYDIIFSKLQNTQSGSHEISFNYVMKGTLPTGKQKIRYNTRYL